MGIGVSIFLLALGAIFAFAVEADLNGLDIAVVGYVLMIAGALGLLLTFSLLNRRPVGTTAVVTEETVVRDRPVY